MDSNFKPEQKLRQLLLKTLRPSLSSQLVSEICKEELRIASSVPQELIPTSLQSPEYTVVYWGFLHDTICTIATKKVCGEFKFVLEGFNSIDSGEMQIDIEYLKGKSPLGFVSNVYYAIEDTYKQVQSERASNETKQ